MKRNTQLAVIPDEWKEKFLARIETWEGESSQDKQAQIDRLKPELAGLKAKIDRLNNAFADGSLDTSGVQGTQESARSQKSRIGATNCCSGDEQSQSARTLAKLDFRGKSGRKMGF